MHSLPDAQHGRFSGRAEDHRLVHVGVSEGAPVPRPGDVVSVVIDDAKPYFLLSDSGYALRRTGAGDAYDRAQADSCGAPAAGPGQAPATTALGMPTLRAGLDG